MNGRVERFSLSGILYRSTMFLELGSKISDSMCWTVSQVDLFTLFSWSLPPRSGMTLSFFQAAEFFFFFFLISMQGEVPEDSVVHPMQNHRLHGQEDLVDGSPERENNLSKITQFLGHS